jgi:hypothetical protein
MANINGKITVVTISDPTGTQAPSAGSNGQLGRIALDSKFELYAEKSLVNDISSSLNTKIDGFAETTVVADISSYLDNKFLNYAESTFVEQISADIASRVTTIESGYVTVSQVRDEIISATGSDGVSNTVDVDALGYVATYVIVRDQSVDLTLTSTSIDSTRVHRKIYLRIKDDGTSRNLTFPGTWTWITAPPSATSINKWMFIDIEVVDVNNTVVIFADWKNQY